MAISKRLRFEIFRRDGFRCTYCGASPRESQLRADHILPEALGGETVAQNLTTACEDCNSGKSSIAPDSAHVAQVNEMAITWALALAKVTRIRAQQQAVREEYRQAFSKAWDAEMTWARTEETWRETVDRFGDLGLTEEDLRRAVQTAAAAKIPDSARWKYFCGVAWRTARDIQEAARTLIATGES